MKDRRLLWAVGFIALFTLSVLVFLLPCVIGGKNISELENRTLTAFPSLNSDSFLSGSFQDDLEEALGDHILLSEEIRAVVRDAQASALNLEHSAIYMLDPSLRSGYSQIADGYYSYGGDPSRIVEKPEDLAGKTEGLRVFADKLNAIQGIRTYLYFIQNSRSVDFDHPEESGVPYDLIRSFFRLDGNAEFTVADYADYSRWFYQTDHHWNNRGSYRGYREIITMIERGEPIPHGDEIEFPVIFNGSYARQTRQLSAEEPFRVYTFEIPKHNVTLNGKRGKYGRLDSYLKGRYEDDSLTNHYANCYGGEYGEIVYDFGTEGKGTLLMIASSYSNPINALIASHFDRTVVVDPRYWEKWTGESFDPAVCVTRAGADTVLLLGDIRFFTADLAAEGGGD